MKMLGLDRICVIVKDMDKAIESMADLFETEFHEFDDTVKKGGIRVAVNLPDASIELMSLVEPEIAKAANFSFLDRIVELSEQGYEGPYATFLAVEDGQAAADDAISKGIRVDQVLRGEHPGIVSPYVEAFYNQDDMVMKGFYSMSRHPK